MPSAVQQLVRSSDGAVVVRHLHVARGLPARVVGLLGKRTLRQEEGLFIPRCRAIHTCFMRFSMDAVFVNRQMMVVDVQSQIRPFRLLAPVTRAWGVVELAGGRAAQLNLQPGDPLVLQPGS